VFARQPYATLRRVRGAVLLCLTSLVAFAVARPMKVPLEKWGVERDSFGVVLTFAPGTTRATAQQVVDALAHGGGFKAGQLQAVFFHTPQARAVGVLFSRPGFTVGKGLELARDASAENGVRDAYAFFHPGPTDEDVELEAWWRYQLGELKETRQQNFRDSTEYVTWVRRHGSEQALARAELAWPLTKLAHALGIPGRDALVQPWALLDWAEGGWPNDVGDDLVRLSVEVPGEMAMEMRQQAELGHVSPSKLVRDALNAASTDGHLGDPPSSDVLAPYDEGAKPSAKGKSAPREQVVFLDRDTFFAVQTAAESASESFGKLVEYAWRRAHPFKAPR
jgi:hypothetical protein